MLPDEQKKAYSEFYKAARYNKTLDGKTTLLVHLATALSVGCDP